MTKREIQLQEYLAENGSILTGLRARLAEWTDFDMAAYHLGVCLGLFSGASTVDEFLKYKHIFWTNCTLGNMLSDILSTLHLEGILLNDDDDGVYKWNPNFEVK